MTVLPVQFYPDNSYDVKKKQRIQNSFTIVPTDEGKCVVIYFTIDGTFTEEYSDLKNLLRLLRNVLGAI